jgi:hypothetical protein
LLKVFAFLMLLVSSLHAADLSGTWDFVVDTPQNGKGMPVVTLKQSGQELTGVFNGRIGELKLNGTINGSAVQLIVHTPQGDLHFQGIVDSSGRNVKGSFQAADRGTGTFSGAKRKPSK